MRELAVYGKGGIGKSTISANLSAALATLGKRVVQIGCDPKHDSTRLLLNGKRITTVLDYLRVTKPLEQKIEDVLIKGYLDVACVEAGGPKPGVGCAGRGIITAFEMLDRYDVKDDYDITIYDVLGDVVCGGFAVPIRSEYADTILIVTSGEYMSLYAANNILRGVQNYDYGRKRIAGIVYNQRNIQGEDERVAAFAEAVSLPICAVIPRSDDFAEGERKNKTVVESGAGVSRLFYDLADTLLNGETLYAALPLTDEELEYTVFGTTVVEESSGALVVDAVVVEESDVEPTERIDLTDSNRYLSLGVIRDDPLHGCAFNGAISMSVHLQDVVILAHSPKSCIYISYQTVNSAGRRGLYERGALMPVAIAPYFESTYMSQSDMVFGGTDKLLEKVAEIKKDKPKAIVVISSCPSGIIGDDVDRARELSDADTQVVVLKTDGNLTGDYLQGMLMSYTSLAKEIIDPSAPLKPDMVNIVFEKVVSRNTDENYEVITDLLSEIGVGVNCRFLCQTDYKSLKEFTSAPLNLLAYNDYTGVMLKEFFETEYGCNFFPEGFPVGFRETELWLEKVAAFFNRSEAVSGIIAARKAEYERQVERLHPQLSGRALMIVTYNKDVDWVLKAAYDVGIDVVMLGMLKYSQDSGFRTNLERELNVIQDYDGANMSADIARYKPDILLTNYASSIGNSVFVADTIPMCPDSGFFSGLNMITRWATLLKLNLKGEWSNDERLFEHYYS